MIKYVNKFRKFWIEDFSFVLLLLLLIFTVFILPPAMAYIDYGANVLNILLLFLFFIGIFSALETKWIIITSLLFISHLTLKIIRFSNLPIEFYTFEKYISLLNIILFIFINLRLLFRNNSVNSFRVVGAVNVYLLIGLMGAVIFEIIDITFQNTLSADISIETDEKNYPTFIYYSFVCLTTVGFGDISPINGFTKMFSVFLSSIGILYPAVVIARLVSLVNYEKQNDKHKKTN